MGTRELRAIYGGTNSRQTIARAIRAEIEDGAAILEAESRALRWCDAVDPADKAQAAKAQAAWMRAHAARVNAENVVRRKHDIPLRRDEVALPPVI
jgi:hypothetical protein